MKTLLLVGLIVATMCTSAVTVTAASWILPIADRQGGGWTEYAGAGYNGTSAWGASTMDGVRRVYWKTDNIGLPAGTNLYYIEAFGCTAGGTGWQPIESQINGSAGEVYPMDPNIPWAGMWGTNHQYIGSDGANTGTWLATGPGPHTPESADYNAGANGTMMWLKPGSWLYAKWDFGWDINRAWSAIRITEVNPIPEPSSLLALLAGLPALAIFRRRK